MAVVTACGVGGGVGVAKAVVVDWRVVIGGGSWSRSGPGGDSGDVVLPGGVSVYGHARRVGTAVVGVVSDVARLALRGQSLVLRIVFSALPPSQVVALLTQSSSYWYFRPEGWVRVGGPSNLAIGSKRTGRVTKVAWALPASAVALYSFAFADLGTDCCRSNGVVLVVGRSVVAVVGAALAVLVAG